MKYPIFTVRLTKEEKEYFDKQSQHGVQKSKTFHNIMLGVILNEKSKIK